MEKRKEKSRGLRFRALALSAALCVTLCTLPVWADAKQEIANSKDKISSLQDEKKKVQDTISNLEALKSDTKAYVTKLDGTLETLSDEIEKLADDITAKESEISDTQTALAAAKETEAEQYASMKLRIRYMYEKGDTSFIDMILTAKSWSELLNRAEYISKISDYDRVKLEEYKATRADIAQKETQLEAEHADLVSLKGQTEAKQESVETLIAQKQKEIASYNAKISAANDQVNELNADIQAQEDNIAAMEAEIKRQEEEARKKAEEAARKAAEEKTKKAQAEAEAAKKKAQAKTRTLSGGMVWPCPASSRISSYFGGRSSPTEGASTNHKGIDIPAPSGSSVVAAAGGQVVIATYSVSAGNYVMINHGSGVYTVYMHMSSLSVSQGQEVSQGQKVGAVGSTGYSTGAHLHFGVRKNGSYVDPLGYVG